MATESSGDDGSGEIVYYDSTRLGFVAVAFVVAVPIVLVLIAFDLSWWVAVMVTLPLTLTVSFFAMPRRRFRLGADFLGLREGRRPEVLISLHDVLEIERVWVLGAGYHLELRTENTEISLLGLGDFSRPFLHDIGARLSSTASPQLRIGPTERDLLGMRS